MTKGALLLAALLVTAGISPARTFTSAEGKSIEAEIVRATAIDVTLRLANKRTAKVPLAKLSEADQEFVKAWLADQLPRLRITPNLVRSNKDERYRGTYTYKTSKQIQSYVMSVDVSNEENVKGLEESTMKFILVGRSTRDTKRYKILSIQKVPFEVAPSGKTTVRFKKVVNHYYDTSSYRHGYKCIGYALFAERNKDQREVYTHGSTAGIKDAIYSIIDLEIGDETDKNFQKVEALVIPAERGIVPGRPERKPEDVIVVE